MKRVVLGVALVLACCVKQQFAVSSVTKKCSKNCSISKNTWLPRSFSSYSMHDISQEKYLWNPLDDHQQHHLQVGFITEYAQNFSNKCGASCKNLGSMPLWSGTNRLTVGNNDGRAQLDAYQLGLGNVIVDKDGIAGIIELNPKIQQYSSDLMLYYVQKKENPGIYFKIHLPLSAMTLRHGFKEIKPVVYDSTNAFTQKTTAGANVTTTTITTATVQTTNPTGTAPISIATQSSTPNPSSTITYYSWRYPIATDDGHESISAAFFGGAHSSNSLDGSHWKPFYLRKGRIEPRKQTQIRVPDITASLGYNFIAHEDGFFGLGFKFSCPTGNVPTADYMLEPIVGRAGVWGVGFECMGKYQLWQNALDTDSLDVWVQGELLHLSSGRRPNFRSFDLKKNGPGSKYLLVQHYAPEYQHLGTTPFSTSVQMNPQSLHAALEITTLPVFSKFSVEGSFAALIDYNHKSWNVAVGAEVWGRSEEQLSIDISSAVNQRHPNLNAYAVLGRQVDGYLIDGQSSELKTYYCQPLAKINQSLDPVILVGTPPYVAQPTSLPTGIADARLSKNRIPEKLTEALDIEGAQASSVVTGKVFGQIGYTWQDRCYMPNLALVGGVELTGTTNNAVQFWTLALQGTLNF